MVWIELADADCCSGTGFWTDREATVRDSRRPKTPQTSPQTAGSDEIPKTQMPMSHGDTAHGQSDERRGRDSNPGWTCIPAGFQDRFRILAMTYKRRAYSPLPQGVALNVALPPQNHNSHRN